MTMRVKRACMACGREVAVLHATQNGGGGKSRVKHKCPHGVVCITGVSPHFGTGFNNAPTMGQHKCLECHKARREERGFITARRAP